MDVDRLVLLARLGVREVWYGDRGHIRIFTNRGQTWVASDRSQFMPAVTGPMLSRHLLNRHRIGEDACIADFVAESLTA
jgi:hypothetical protein